MKLTSTSALAIALLACCHNALAQQPTCMAGKSMPGMTKDALLPPPQRIAGVGNASIDISTTNPDAKFWFNQGLNLLHDFWDFESSRAFEESVKADPNCAMCWWGIYQAGSFRGDENPRTKEALAKAKKLSKHATKPEKLYIKAADQSENHALKRDKHSDENATPKDSKETKTLRKLVALSPNDMQAKIFLAESILSGFKKNGDPKPGTVEGQAILTQILVDHPDDSAANHYWIHAVEPGNHPELAIPSARKLADLAPASGHMVHMPGHIFYRTGDYETARISFENSMNTDEAYMRDQHIKVDDDWNYVHNMMYYIADLLEEGRMFEAAEVSTKLNTARGDTLATLYTRSTRDGLTRLDVALPVALRTGDWTRAASMLEASAPDKSLTNLVWIRTALLEYTRGMAALQANHTDEASKHLDALNASLKSKPDEKPMAGMPMPGSTPSKDLQKSSAHNFMDLAALELQGALLTAQNKSTEADAAFKKAADAETALGYHEPPYYIRPVGETRGDALLAAGRNAEARQAYEDALKERPNSGFPLYGIARANAAAKNDAAATAAYARLIAAWPHADPDLPQLRDAHLWMQAHPSIAAK
jgi:tetratricopeptide (TPR) repeat protein